MLFSIDSTVECWLQYCWHCRVGLALDAYLIPVEDGIEGRLEQPLLFINTWTFQWAENVAKIKSLVDTDVTSDSECVWYSITVH